MIWVISIVINKNFELF